MLALRGLTRLYGGVSALDRVELELRAGELHLLVGGAGAGKTTLLRLLGGFEQPSAGEILVAGRPQRLRSPLAARRLGIGFAGDAPLCLDELTVAEHATLGAEPVRAGCLRRRLARREIAALAVKLGLCNRSRDGFDARARVGTLDPAGRRQVELLGLAWGGAAILLLDEPASGLPPGQADRVIAALAALRAWGRTLLVATRTPGRLLEVADRATLLEDGRITATAAAPDFAELGAPLGTAAPPPRQTVASESSFCKGLSTGSELQREQIVQVKDLWVILKENGRERDLLAGLDLVVYRGEIHGVVAADGQGAEELVEAVAGVRRPDGGRIYLGDEDVTRAGVCARRRLGLAYLPADGAPGGLLGALSLHHNALLGRTGGQRRGWQARRRAAALAAGAAVLPGAERLPAAALARHHRQALLLVRELAERPGALLAVGPTRGLRRDEAAPLWRTLRAERDRGLAVLLCSSDLEELAALADRVTVMAGGRAVAELAGPALSAAALGAVLADPPALPAGPVAVEGAAAR